MKKKMDENIDALFQKAKEVPTEIPFEKMEKMILNFPNHPIPVTETQWFVKLFNLKYIAMTIIPIIAALTFWWAPDTNLPEVTTVMVEPSTQKRVDISSTSIEKSKEISKMDLFDKEINLSAPTPPKLPSPKIEKISAEKELVKIQTPKLELIKKDIRSLKKENRKISKPATKIMADLIKVEPTPLSTISNTQLRKLRRTLYKNLIADGLVTNKFTVVELLLLPDKTILNEKPLSTELFIKYRSLTEIVGVGPVRKIKMASQFIIVGDFFETGFKGSGLGSFSKDFLNLNESLFSPLPLSKQMYLKTDSYAKENKALILFAQEIRSTSPVTSGKKRLFGPNLKDEKVKKLHAELKRLLTEDKIIDEVDRFAVIQFPNKTIRINGKDLHKEQLDKYKKLMKEYKIKPEKNRLILFSTKIIKIGNFNGSGFSGTQLFLN